MPSASPMVAQECEVVPGQAPPPPPKSSSVEWSSPRPVSIEISLKDRSVGPELDLPGNAQPLDASVLPRPESPVPLSATSSSSSTHPIFSWPTLGPGVPPPGRDPFDATQSFSEDPFGNRSSESSSGDDYDALAVASSSSGSGDPTPVPGWLSPRDQQGTHSSMGSLYASVFSDPGPLLHNPQPRLSGTFDPYHAVSLELADTLQMAIQTLLHVTPPDLLDNGREQYASCAIQLPATTISALLSTMRGLNYLSSNIVPICEGQSAAAVRVVRELELGELVQTVADQLSAEFLQADVELVLLQGDQSVRNVNVLGDREGIGFVLAHVVRQILAVAHKGDTIELGFHSSPLSPRRRSEAGITYSPSASPAPVSPSTDLLCTFEISLNTAHTLDLNAATPKAEVVNPFTQLGKTQSAEAQLPKLHTPLCDRLMRQMDAWIRADAVPSSPGYGSPRSTYELSLILTPGRAEPPARIDDDGLRLPAAVPPPPTSSELAEFMETLRDRKVTLFANGASIFTRQLVTYLTGLGMDIFHIDSPSTESPPPARFVIIDEDLAILRRELARLKPDTLSLRRPLKRPGLFRSSKSTSHIRPHSPSTSIIHLTSLDKYQQVREAVMGLASSGYPEVLVVPKPVGPRRLITSLFTAVRQPLVDSAFSPIATSPRSPQISSGNRTPTGVMQEGFFDSVELQVEGTPQLARSPLSEFPPSVCRETPRLPISTPSSDTPASEYFSKATLGKSTSTSTSVAAGVVLKSPDGRPLGVYFEPPGSGRSVYFGQSAPRKPNSRRASSEKDTPLGTSPIESPHISRRASTISTTTEESVTCDEKELPAPPASTVGRRKTLPSPPDAKPIMAHGRERSSTVTRHTDKQLPDIAENQVLARPPLKADVVVPPINVLIVEDNPINQNILSMFFRKKKIRHQTAKDGVEAVEKWRTGGFHLILMDIQLPTMDGIEATKEIRKLEKNNNIGMFPSTPLGDNARPMEIPAASPFRSSVIIVALTASSLQTDRVAALAAGCNDFLTKPVSLKWLEKKTVEWGCMQALIDFEGWRRWKGSDNTDASETKLGFQTGPAAAAHRVASRLRLDPNKRSMKKPAGEKPLPTLPTT